MDPALTVMNLKLAQKISLIRICLSKEKIMVDKPFQKFFSYFNVLIAYLLNPWKDFHGEFKLSHFKVFSILPYTWVYRNGK